MSRIPGLKYEHTNSKSEGRQSRSCTVADVDSSRCIVTFQLKGGAQHRAVVPVGRLFSQDGACAHLSPPVVGEKLNCDMTPVDYRTLNAQWLAQFAWRGKMDSSNKSSQALLQEMQALVTELSSDAGVVQFVAPSGGRERCSFGRAAVLAAGGAPLPEGQPLTRLLQVGAAVTCDCQRSSVVAGCRYVADKVWMPGLLSESDDPSDEEEEYEQDEYEARAGSGGGGGGYIHRVMLREVLGRVALVVNFKAVLAFEHAGQQCRALLLTAKYTFSEKATAQERRDLTQVLSKGDQVVFTCHEYDKPDGTDRCGWWVMEAEKLEPSAPSVGREAGYFNQGLLYEKIGTITDVLQAEGKLKFVLDKRREVAWFSVAEVFFNGRPCTQQLSDALEIGMRVCFNAGPAPDRPRGADWRCTCVWRGEQPTVEASQLRSEQVAAKKAKKTKSSRSKMNELDDFDVPSLQPPAAGRGWESPVARIVSVAEPLAGGDVRRVKAGGKSRKNALDGFADSDVGNGVSNLGWSGDGWNSTAGGQPVAGSPVPDYVNDDLVEPVEGRQVSLELTSQHRRPDRPALVPLLQPSPPPPELNPARPLPAPSQGSAAVPRPAPSQEPAVVPRPAPSQESAAVPRPAPSQEPAAVPRLAPSQEPAAVPRPAPWQESAAVPRPAPSQEPAAVPRPSAAERALLTPAALAAAAAAAASCRSQGDPVAAQTSVTDNPPPPSGISGGLQRPTDVQSGPPGLPAPAFQNGDGSAALQRQQNIAARTGLLRGRVEREVGLPATQPPPQQLAAPPLMPHSHYLSGPPGLAAPWIQHIPILYGGGVAHSAAIANQQYQHQQHMQQQLLRQQQLERLHLEQQRQEQLQAAERQRLEQERGGHNVSLTAGDIWSTAVSSAGWEPTVPLGRQSQASGSTSGSSLPAASPSPSPSDLTREAALASEAEALARKTEAKEAALREAALARERALVSEAEAAACAEEAAALADHLQRTNVQEPKPVVAASVPPVSGRGVILAFVDEKCGLAEWEHDGCVEQVMFERHNCFWLGAPMDELDLTDCYSAGEEVSFQCVPAPPNQPYQWVATQLHQLDD